MYQKNKDISVITDDRDVLFQMWCFRKDALQYLRLLLHGFVQFVVLNIFLLVYYSYPRQQVYGDLVSCVVLQTLYALGIII